MTGSGRLLLRYAMDAAADHSQNLAIYGNDLLAGVDLTQNVQGFRVHHIAIDRDDDHIIAGIVIQVVGPPAQPLYILCGNGQRDIP